MSAVLDQLVGAADGDVPQAQLPEVAGTRVGCDVVDVRRIERLLTRRPQALATLFSPREQADATRDGVPLTDPAALRRLAARFAAKEAVAKLLDRPSLRWTDVEVRRGDGGAPQLWLCGAPTDVAVSLSHDGDTAFAVVVATEAAIASLPVPTTLAGTRH